MTIGQMKSRKKCKRIMKMSVMMNLNLTFLRKWMKMNCSIRT